ncbi:MAG TPA: dihydroneopterin aldolase [Alphaproteobacteria bacterium]|nr:dihydroneopterin aldolase [Alphaproteobacteria bacterium]HOO50079.1 dihydroneopterin aldolase [Alphaproteobacteria bacterium]
MNSCVDYSGGENLTFITVHHMRLPARIGVYDHEKTGFQDIIVDVEALLSDWEVKSDNIEDTVSYDFIVSEIRRLSQIHHDLVETYAESIARICLSDKRLIRVKISLQKPDIFDDCVVGTTIIRYRK